MLIAVVLESMVIDDVTLRFCNVYNNFMYNAKYTFVLSFELTVEEMHFFQQRLSQCLGGGQVFPFVKTCEIPE